MKILVFGKTGQVARELQHYPEVVALARADADLSDPAACARIVENTDADMIINAAAYTDVNKAEVDEELATLVNTDSPIAIAKAAAARKIPFVHISTDYVFNGTGEKPWAISDTPSPINAYGRTKYLGELGILAAGGVSAILRTSWVFSAHGANFVKTMVRLGKERDALNIVNDQVGGPTPAADIAATSVLLAKELHNNPNAQGVYHYSGAPDVSWADFSAEIFKQAGCQVTVAGIPSSDYPTPAPRPLNSRLDCTEITRKLGVARPDWRVGLHKVLTELGDAK